MLDNHFAKAGRIGLYLSFFLMGVLPWLLLAAYLRSLWMTPSITWERTQLVFGAYFLIWSAVAHIQIWTLQDAELTTATRRQASLYMIRKIPYIFFVLFSKTMAFFLGPVVIAFFVKPEDTQLTGFFQKLLGHNRPIEGNNLLERMLWVIRNRHYAGANMGDAIESYTDVSVYGVRYNLDSKAGQFGIHLLQAGDSFEIAQLSSFKWFAYYSRWGCKIADEIGPWLKGERAYLKDHFDLAGTSIGFKRLQTPM